ncbi:MAG: hypothetical protein ACP5RI_02970 [Candidatus Micrarchaeia archaeon]
MIKNIVYIGVLILIIAIIILFYEGSLLSNINFSSVLSNMTVVKNYTIKSNSFVTYPINLNTSSIITTVLLVRSKINFYLMNNTAFSKWSSEVENGSSGLVSAESLEGKGVFDIFNNITNATLPEGLVRNITTTPLYSSPTSILNIGNYRIVLDNTKGSASFFKSVNASFMYIPPITNATINNPAFSNIKSSLDAGMWIGGIFFLILLVGLALIIYGLLKKPKVITIKTEEGGKEKLDLSDIDKLYEGIEEKEKKVKHKKIKKRKNKK